jgi:hypothetical protein
MTTFRTRRTAAELNRKAILQTLKPFDHSSPDAYTAPQEMTVIGISKQSGRSLRHLYSDMHYLEISGLIEKIGKRTTEGARKRNRVDVWVLTEKGRMRIR